MPAVKFTWSDAWLLYSIGLAVHGGKGTLKDVIVAGDAVNRAVFTPQELRRGIAKLTASGLAGEHDEAFSLTERGEELMVRAGKAGESLWDQLKEIARLLDAVPYEEWHQPNYEDAEWSYPGISDEAVKEALAQYSAEADEILNEFIRKSGA
jgi:hypothetical protein